MAGWKITIFDRRYIDSKWLGRLGFAFENGSSSGRIFFFRLFIKGFKLIQPSQKQNKNTEFSHEPQHLLMSPCGTAQLKTSCQASQWSFRFDSGPGGLWGKPFLKDRLHILSYCWWFRNPAPVEVGSVSHYLQGFIHPRWCRISSINSSMKRPILQANVKHQKAVESM